MTRNDRTHRTYHVVNNSIFYTLGNDSVSDPDNLQFYRRFPSRAAALAWLWKYHPVQH